ncbi:MAG TPA: hypothetical protein PK263_03350, partial [bacterium]|nr:hypothetical protein [bacterium]
METRRFIDPSEFRGELGEIPLSFLVHDLLSLDSVEKARMTERVQAFGGLLRVMVHPWYGRNRGYQTGERERNIENFIADYLAKSKQETPAMLFLEEKDYYESSKRWIKGRVKESFNEAYLLPTRYRVATPNILDTEEPKPQWDAFSKILSDVGVKKVIAGGTQFTLVDPESPCFSGKQKIEYSALMEEYRIYKNLPGKVLPGLGICVARTAVELMKRGFEVEISSLVAPDK